MTMFEAIASTIALASTSFAAAAIMWGAHWRSVAHEFSGQITEWRQAAIDFDRERCDALHALSNAEAQLTRLRAPRGADGKFVSRMGIKQPG